MNSCRAARNGLPSAVAGAAVSAPAVALGCPNRSAMTLGKHQAIRSPKRRMGTSTQGPEGVGDADTRVPREPAGHSPRHPRGENREDERPPDDFGDRTRATAERARLK